MAEKTDIEVVPGIVLSENYADSGPFVIVTWDGWLTSLEDLEQTKIAVPVDTVMFESISGHFEVAEINLALTTMPPTELLEAMMKGIIEGFAVPESAIDTSKSLDGLFIIPEIIDYDINETFVGTAGNDTIEGRMGNDLINGLAGADVLHGGLDDDTLIGGSGIDDLRGGDGNDVLYSDTLDVGSTPVAGQVYRLFRATLDREPGTPGLLGWTAQIVEGTSTLEEVTSGFVNSLEFQTTYGSTTNTEFVTLLYQNVLDREPDSGLNTWVNALNTNTLTREQVTLSFSESTEFQNTSAVAARAFVEARSESVWVDDVYRLYQATLGREPDSSGFANWTSNLSNGGNFLNVVSGFVNSTEFQNTYGTTTDDEFITLLFQNVLGREPAPAGKALWLERMADGMSREVVVQSFSQSQEFRDNTAEDVVTFVKGPEWNPSWYARLYGDAGDNTLFGGTLYDQFMFFPETGSDEVHGLQEWDELRFFNFGYNSHSEVRGHMTELGHDVVFQDQGKTVTLLDTSLGDITDDMILFY